MENAWIVEGLIPAAGSPRYTDIISPGGHTSRFRLAFCVATGRDFLGMKIPRAMRTAYFNFDLMNRSMLERGNHIAKALDAMPDHDMLRIYNLRGKDDALRENPDAFVNEIKNDGYEFVVFAIRSRFLFFDDHARSLILKAREFATVLSVGLDGPQTHPTTFLKLIDYWRLGVRDERAARKDLVVGGRYTGRAVIPLVLENDRCFVKV